MPRVYRVMTIDGGMPKVGPNARELGVRPNYDIPMDDNGRVRSRTGGMSVSPSLSELPLFRLPQRLRQIFPEARGKNSDACWRFGEGRFEEGEVTSDLYFRPDSRVHGLIEPTKLMDIQQFQKALAMTRSQWLVDETLE